MAWDTSGVTVNPAANAIIADTLAIAAGGQTNVKVIVGGNVATNIAVEWRNAANTATIKDQIVAFPVNEAATFDFPGLSIGAGERIRLRVVAAVTGSVQGSIFTF
jgi:hypothetical protein